MYDSKVIVAKFIPLIARGVKHIISQILLDGVKPDTIYEFFKLDDLMTIVNAHHLNHWGLEVKAESKKNFDKIQIYDGLGRNVMFMKRIYDI